MACAPCCCNSKESELEGFATAKAMPASRLARPEEDDLPLSKQAPDDLNDHTGMPVVISEEMKQEVHKLLAAIDNQTSAVIRAINETDAALKDAQSKSAFGPVKAA